MRSTSRRRYRLESVEVEYHGKTSSRWSSSNDSEELIWPSYRSVSQEEGTAHH